MKNLLKQIFSLILPVTVLVIVPLWIEKNRAIHVGAHLFLGLILILSGLIVMGFIFFSFILIGKVKLVP